MKFAKYEEVLIVGKDRRIWGHGHVGVVVGVDVTRGVLLQYIVEWWDGIHKVKAHYSEYELVPNIGDAALEQLVGQALSASRCDL